MDWTAILVSLIGLLGIVGGSGGMAAAILQRRWAKQDANKQSTQNAVDPQKIDAICNALMVLMVDKIRYLGTCHIYEKSITLEDKLALEEMYKAYQALPNANGHCSTIMAEVRKLQVIEGEHDCENP